MLCFNFQHVCHTLWCPFGSASWYGSCIDIAIETQGLTVSIIYKLELKWKDSSVSGQHSNLPEDETLGELIQESFLKAFNVKLKKLKRCRHCRLNVWISERDKTQLPEVVLLHLNLFTNSLCQLDSIFDKSTTIIGKVIEVPVNESVLVSVVSLEKRLSSVKGMKIIYRFLKTPCNPIYHIDKDKVCPEVEVSASVLKSKIKDVSMLSGIMGRSGNQTDLPDNTTIKLCWDDYVSMMRESYPGTANLIHKHVTPAITLLQFTFTLIFL